jgi:hypothetical protein
MYFITPLPRTARGNAGLFVVVERLSKLIRIAATPAHLDAPEVARLFPTHVSRHHGFPLEIISDRDAIFMSKFWTTLFGMLRVKLRPSSAYHTETDGQTEVVNRKVEEILRCFVNHNQSNWDLFLIDLEFSYNSAPHSSTTLSPFFLTYETEPRGAPYGITTTSNPPLPILLRIFISRSLRLTKPSFPRTNTQPFKPIAVADHPPSPLAILSYFLPEI